MNIGFFGTPTLAAQVLADILATTDIAVSFVVTGLDRPVGRTQQVVCTPVKSLAQNHNIPVYTPQKVRGNTEFLDTLRTYDCDYYIVVAYGQILPQELLDIPSKMCINIHGSILPAYRGASPIQSAILHGETRTGVTIMQMSLGMDEGGILKIRYIDIDPADTSERLFQKFGDISGEALISTLRELDTGGITHVPQVHTDATYCKKITKEHGEVNWQHTATDIYNMYRAYTPWPGIYSYFLGKKILLENVGYMAKVGEDGETNGETTEIGRVIVCANGQIGVVCGKDILTISKIKIEGKKSQDIQDFIRGHREFVSTVLPSYLV